MMQQTAVEPTARIDAPARASPAAHSAASSAEAAGICSTGRSTSWPRRDGDPSAVAGAHEAAWQRFRTVLGELVAELPGCASRSAVAAPCAGRWRGACGTPASPFRPAFITPMAAVAGAVAQELIGFYRRPGIARAWINNGGDIALHLAPGRSARVGLFADLARLRLGAARPARHRRPLHAARRDAGARRRHQRLARPQLVARHRRQRDGAGGARAAEADAAATVIANAVDVPDPAIHRRPACECKDDSDLGDMPGDGRRAARSRPAQVRGALDAGAARAVRAAAGRPDVGGAAGVPGADGAGVEPFTLMLGHHAASRPPCSAAFVRMPTETQGP